MAKVIILNGPAGCGKDTLAKELVELGFANRIASFKIPLFNIVKASLGAKSYAEFLEGYNDRTRKEKPEDFLNGLSRREFMIAVSEQFIKPVLGNSYFGEYLARALSDNNKVAVVSDGGFRSEVEPIAAAGHDTHIVRLHRAGYNFVGDSRSYIYEVNGAGSHDIDIVPGEIQATAQAIVKCVSASNH